MSEHLLEKLNLGLAVRIFVDSVSYSSPLPLWTQLADFQYEFVSMQVGRSLRKVLNGEQQIRPAFEMKVPYKKDDLRTWFTPSLTMQIILQACTAKIGSADKLDNTSSKRIFTYNNTPNTSDFLTDQLDQWLLFQDQTKKQLETHEYILQLDVKQYFASVDRRRFAAFLKAKTADEIVVDFLIRLLDGWMQDRPGLPLINDSLFYLGDAYLNTVDDIIGRHTGKFIRFMDDYRLFSNKRSDLENVYSMISRDLAVAGYKINQMKLRLGSKADYFKSISQIERINDAMAADEMIDDGREYLGPMLFTKVVSPVQLANFIEIVVGDASRLLTIRPGRLLMREIRKLRTNKQIGSDVFSSYLAALSAKPGLRTKILRLIQDYAAVNGAEWQLVWLLYLLEDVIVAGDAKSGERAQIEFLVRQTHLNPIVSLWARRLLGIWEKIPPVGDVFAHKDADYLEQGRLLYGAN